ncbi:hypothetical protein A3B18_03905 [Candidatus Giovannonibacteria bacterium RIFCSPLOWO2_01_FULL_46_13]|uniref:Polyprenyl synthetase n=1 Tax=Candidatus Giovannonibacteria bacterium RIFCSPLOWO2_01_FULL_46_13 TaxID=1798352 RepID=A0A1F5X4U1_9BACT|nr:MAG: hypothetical protein A3E35_00825 [Candidatus Giovannonibacteria bacterium RIFCSPHIGHO2_12_FULL_44_22]OGF82918.1 MAG: hypothetical protein A3B18_03905 [Candidatus Giovannonibacteria bacterium RIFCSPLOWO2_01_FULL_46_13]
MNSGFLNHKKRIDARIRAILAAKKKIFLGLGFWGADSRKKLESFLFRGKTLRGSLVALSYVLFRKKLAHDALDVGASLELIHSALLIQDDIMDEDEMRRGMKTIHRQYEILGKKKGIKNSYHFGEGAGICLSDVAFFIAFETLGELNLSKKVRRDLWELFSKELMTTAIGQIEDVALAGKAKNLELYRAKTARYTFVLPLLAGAILAGKNKKSLREFEKLAEILGIIFQLKDDELDDGGKVNNSGIADLTERARKLIRTLPAQNQKDFFASLLKYNLERKS